MAASVTLRNLSSNSVINDFFKLNTITLRKEHFAESFSDIIVDLNRSVSTGKNNAAKKNCLLVKARFLTNRLEKFMKMVILKISSLFQGTRLQ